MLVGAASGNLHGLRCGKTRFSCRRGGGEGQPGFVSTGWQRSPIRNYSGIPSCPEMSRELGFWGELTAHAMETLRSPTGLAAMGSINGLFMACFISQTANPIEAGMQTYQNMLGLDQCYTLPCPLTCFVYSLVSHNLFQSLPLRRVTLSRGEDSPGSLERDIFCSRVWDFKNINQKVLKLLQLCNAILAPKICPTKPLISAVPRLTEEATEKQPVILATYVRRYTHLVRWNGLAAGVNISTPDTLKLVL